MKNFIHPDFLLESATAKEIFHDYAEAQPIIDFHCHLSPKLIAEDHRFDNLGEVWLAGDHYKWRAMRTNGVDEAYCTGAPSFYDKFLKWADTVPYTAGNPLYHWTHLELARYFNIFDLLSPKTADTIYHQASEMLKQKEFSTRNLLKKMKVEVVGTTDDPADSLEYHIQLKNFEIQVRPTWRPDNLIKTDNPETFNQYINQLEEVSGAVISSFADLLKVLDQRHAFFHETGCRASDHGLDRMYYTDAAGTDPEKAFQKIRTGQKLNEQETEGYRYKIMQELCKLNHKRGWVQQFHLGAMRNNNTRLFNKLGPDTGFDSIANPQDSYKISRFLDSLDVSNQLAKTILYNLNPADNEVFVTMIGNFQDGSVPGKMQYGAAWWFLDQKTGMEKHLADLSALGLLSRFVGMVTDSRSFLSYPRHEYFRRIACNYIGQEVEKGVIPKDQEILKTLVEGISYQNAKAYFGF
ncbi:glucuronate isomerase [Thermophagus sp. OGC60D27]|uniref:glucuronate isomerase n=1 Tax=Thermophagus sp. OGC60D27 TaxID=3458415 RepID=UPI00403821B7